MTQAEEKWTQFSDMHSGGGLSESPYENIYIEAPIEQAKVIFYNRFGHSPERVSCTCCGVDYSIYESNSLEELTEYHRGLENAISLDEYKKEKGVLFIYSKDIKDDERIGEVPEQGYVWRD